MTTDPKISLLVPTHNRAASLKRLLESIFSHASKVSYEVVVVDNNSKDQTKELVHSYSDRVRYVFEGNTSFTRARHTGAQHARGQIMVYLDDDVIVHAGTLEAIEEIFDKHPACAVAGGKILPHFEQEPPQWVLDLQSSFNGLSLYNLGNQEKEVDAVPGPIMAIRKSVYQEIGGFPPDTVGVETNVAEKTFKKLYVGPGDYGFCRRCKTHGYKIFYSPNIIVEHVIPPYRLTQEFWMSRMVGEGHCGALTRINMEEFKMQGAQKALREFENIRCLTKYYIKSKMQRLRGATAPLLPDELWFHYYASMLKMQGVLHKSPGLAAYLWDLGLQGVADKNFDSVLKELPKAYQKLAFKG
ncbi:glycosyltransferase [Candidatus Babeliales bacterium]|nr:glycosyltransferase [Candidatus Babeliales bacterium]